MVSSSERDTLFYNFVAALEDKKYPLLLYYLCHGVDTDTIFFDLNVLNFWKQISFVINSKVIILIVFEEYVNKCAHP